MTSHSPRCQQQWTKWDDRRLTFSELPGNLVTDADYAYKCKHHTLWRDHMADGTEIKIKKGGPAVVTGEFVVIGQDGNPIEDLKSVIALCRCSKSQNQPFCDGSHSKG